MYKVGIEFHLMGRCHRTLHFPIISLPTSCLNLFAMWTAAPPLRIYDLQVPPNKMLCDTYERAKNHLLHERNFASLLRSFLWWYRPIHLQRICMPQLMSLDEHQFTQSYDIIAGDPASATFSPNFRPSKHPTFRIFCKVGKLPVHFSCGWKPSSSPWSRHSKLPPRPAGKRPSSTKRKRRCSNLIPHGHNGQEVGYRFPTPARGGVYVRRDGSKIVESFWHQLFRRGMGASTKPRRCACGNITRIS
jgi:hypothetical protein